jgi:hypothetical protein
VPRRSSAFCQILTLKMTVHDKIVASDVVSTKCQIFANAAAFATIRKHRKRSHSLERLDAEQAETRFEREPDALGEPQPRELHVRVRFALDVGHRLVPARNERTQHTAETTTER